MSDAEQPQPQAQPEPEGDREAPEDGVTAAKTAEDPRKTGPLAPAWIALERGDHVEAARVAGELARSEDEALRNDAQAFLQRLKPDPVILMVFAGTALLLALLAWQYLGLRR